MDEALNGGGGAGPGTMTSLAPLASGAGLILLLPWRPKKRGGGGISEII